MGVFASCATNRYRRQKYTTSLPFNNVLVVAENVQRLPQKLESEKHCYLASEYIKNNFVVALHYLELLV